LPYSLPKNEKPSNAALQLRAHSTRIRDIVAARQLQALVMWRFADEEHFALPAADKHIFRNKEYVA
jgi:hypothetical protein